MNYCIILDEAFLLRASALYSSMEARCGQFHLHYLSLDGTTMEHGAKMEPSEVAVFPARERFLSRREWAWASKPSFLTHVLESLGEPVCYLDADSLFFSSPAEFLSGLEGSDLAITPHRFSPEHQHYLKNGRFNAGFLYLEPTENAFRCLREWEKACRFYTPGSFAEQKFLDVWPSLFGAYVVRHPGVNLAPWNQAQYRYSLRNGQVYVEDLPLIWYHFHEGLNTGYQLHDFVKTHIYRRYGEALHAAERC